MQNGSTGTSTSSNASGTIYPPKYIWISSKDLDDIKFADTTDWNFLKKKIDADLKDKVDKDNQRTMLRGCFDIFRGTDNEEEIKDRCRHTGNDLQTKQELWCKLLDIKKHEDRISRLEKAKKEIEESRNPSKKLNTLLLQYTRLSWINSSKKIDQPADNSSGESIDSIIHEEIRKEKDHLRELFGQLPNLLNSSGTDRRFGPVGNLPLHDFFLLGMWQYLPTEEFIYPHYNKPEYLSLEYRNDLDSWRRYAISEAG